jgi:hypothetical protein
MIINHVKVLQFLQHTHERSKVDHPERASNLNLVNVLEYHRAADKLRWRLPEELR